MKNNYDDIRIDEDCGIFSVNIQGNNTNQTYLGQFKCKCILSPIEQIKSDKLYRDLLGNNAHLAGGHVTKITYALSQLHIRLLETPPFWDGGELGGGHLKDDNVILAVLDKAIECQVRFVEEKQKEKEEIQKMLSERLLKKDLVKDEVEEEEEEEDDL